MLRLEQLEGRDTPTLLPLTPGNALLPTQLIPGWDGPVQVVTGDVDGDHLPETFAVSLAGGSAHVVAYSGATGAVLSNFIAFDPGFRGGGHIYVAQTPQFPATVIVTPGQEGGPIVEELRYINGGLQVVNTQLLPFGDDYRGGIQISYGAFSSLQQPVDAFFLTTAGYPPVFVAMNLETGAIDSQFAVGPADDLSGQFVFTPLGGSVTIPGEHRLGVPIQRGPDVVNDYVPTRIYDVISGEDVTAVFGPQVIV